MSCACIRSYFPCLRPKITHSPSIASRSVERSTLDRLPSLPSSSQGQNTQVHIVAVNSVLFTRTTQVRPEDEKKG